MPKEKEEFDEDDAAPEEKEIILTGIFAQCHGTVTNSIDLCMDRTKLQLQVESVVRCYRHF
jgi:hypothetical protein